MHEVAAIMKLVANQKVPRIYLGKSPDADYLHRAPHMPMGQTPNSRIERIVNNQDAIRYTPNEDVRMGPSYPIILAGSTYQNTSPINYSSLESSIFQYKPGGCSGGYCGQG